eukprot:TRINITY_DN55124_c0_g1_i1.p1 TRINITY_DN55124_c0_g1~~TRINITY_DN55124_c0_g1_i1.p1  ORF type:complete len:1083 (+),score=202.55 TRINITY_DN55124_c0_g1_i1:131-3250(+)
MAVCGKYRKERTHQTGASNRTKEWKPAEQTGPIDFDKDMRSTAPQLMKYKTDLQVPANIHSGQGNQDFEPKLAGHDYRMPNSCKLATKRIKAETKALEQTAELERTSKQPMTITAPSRTIFIEEGGADKRTKGHKVASRWKPDKWFEAPKHTQAPNQKDNGETWNSMESENVQGEIKGHDRLMRTVRRPEDVATPSEDGGQRRHPLDYNNPEYYPGRDSVDAHEDAPANDYQVRPIYLPDFFFPPPENGDSVARMARIREVIRQRYAGRPRLIGVFHDCALTKPGFVFPRDLQQVFDQMGIKVSPKECQMLINAVDKDRKGAVTFEEFADLIYGDRVSVGCKAHEPQERHVRHVTKALVDQLVLNGQNLGKAFCEIDPERRYMVSKDQFANAIGTACNHISNQAIEFLWASQFPGQNGQDTSGVCVDWRNFMNQVSHFAHNHRVPTPCCVQGRKRQYDLLQRTAALTGGDISKIELELNRPDQNAEDEVRIIADKLSHRTTDLPHKPRQAAFLTPHYVEELQAKALRVERSLPKRLAKPRLRQLLKNRQVIHQDELTDMICREFETPGEQEPIPAQEPLYPSTVQPHKVGKAEVQSMEAGAWTDYNTGGENAGLDDGFTGPSSLKLVRADIEAWAATQHCNRDHEVDVEKLIANVYQPPHEKKQLDVVNDGLNRQRRGNRPGRERPPHKEEARYENYWQARYIMDAVNDAIAQVENSNGGKIKPSRIFKRLDFDNDGFITLSDLKNACEKYKIPHQSQDLHAMFSELDRADDGSVDIGEFTRNFDVFQGSLLDNMQKPIKGVYHEGGVRNGGPLQEALDAREKAIAEGRMPGNLPTAENTEKPGSAGVRSSRSAPARSSGGSSKASRMSRAGASIASGAPIIYAPQVAALTGTGEHGESRVSDVIRARYSQWKPQKHELYTSLPKTRYGMTCYPDTRHITEASMPLSGYYMPDAQRFKTTNSVTSIFGVPDHMHPQTEDAMRHHARNEFRVERIRQRQREFTERCHAANEAAREFDELKIARKAMNQLNYERRCTMACA